MQRKDYEGMVGRTNHLKKKRCTDIPIESIKRNKNISKTQKKDERKN